MPTVYHDVIQMPINLDLQGTMKADVFEVAGVSPTNLIRTDQDWGILVKWELRSLIAHSLDGEWHIQVLLERIGVDTPTTPDYDLQVVNVPYDNGTYIPADHQMLWEMKVDVKQGDVAPGTYKLVTVIQLYDDDGNPTAVCGMDEQHGVITVFNPG